MKNREFVFFFWERHKLKKVSCYNSCYTERVALKHSQPSVVVLGYFFKFSAF